MPKIAKSNQARRTPSKQNLEVAVYDSVMSLLSIQEISSEGDLAAVVERRLPTRSLKALIKGGLHEKALYDLVIPRRTLEHREEARPSLLTKDESDKALRIARVIALADSVFGDNQKAWAWLRDPDQFDGKSPLEKSSTSAGARQVEERLYQLYYGMFG